MIKGNQEDCLKYMRLICKYMFSGLKLVYTEHNGDESPKDY
jgi:hypothetical protein